MAIRQTSAVLVFAFIIAFFGFSGIAKSAEIGHEECIWVGHSPFCTGSCPEGLKEVAQSSKDPQYTDVSDPFGRGCWTGTKKLCCKRAKAVVLPAGRDPAIRPPVVNPPSLGGQKPQVLPPADFGKPLFLDDECNPVRGHALPPHCFEKDRLGSGNQPAPPLQPLPPNQPQPPQPPKQPQVVPTFGPPQPNGFNNFNNQKEFPPLPQQQGFGNNGAGQNKLPTFPDYGNPIGADFNRPSFADVVKRPPSPASAGGGNAGDRKRFQFPDIRK